MLNPRMCYAGILEALMLKTNGSHLRTKWQRANVMLSVCKKPKRKTLTSSSSSSSALLLLTASVSSLGASGGILIIWKSSIFAGIEIFKNGYALLVEFTSCHDNSYWVLTNIYGPCDADGKRAFLEWFGNIQMPDDICWLVVGDFNLLRKPENKNRPGGNASQSFFLMKPLALLVWRKYLCMEESSHGQISSNHLCLRD